MSQRIITVKIHRFDPQKDTAPYFQSYEVPLETGMGVLDVLNYIYENLDGSLAYFNHASCRQGVCTRCRVKVNNKTVLSCQAEVTGDLTITPVHGEVVRDLVVQSRERK